MFCELKKSFWNSEFQNAQHDKPTYCTSVNDGSSCSLLCCLTSPDVQTLSYHTVIGKKICLENIQFNPNNSAISRYIWRITLYTLILTWQRGDISVELLIVICEIDWLSRYPELFDKGYLWLVGVALYLMLLITFNIHLDILSTKLWWQL